jgi:glycosyltransferase involved in cell wall biosynthesis
MQISFSGAAEDLPNIPENSKDIVGYSNATHNIFDTLTNNGFDCQIMKPSAPIAIGMGYPTDYKFIPGQYKIGYTAWESTKLRPDWFQIMNNCDEIWATSSWTARVFERQLGRDDIHVYPHGITHDWASKEREVGEVFRFLHIGEPQIRKNGQLVVDAFVELFGNDPKYQLILKCGGINTTRVYTPDGSILGGPDAKYSNIRILTESLSHKQMIDLYHLSHVMVYPTAGEGFGFIPLQALATGMPTISTWQWAEYKDFITIKLKSSLSESVHEVIHPGLTYHVEKEELKRSMLESVDKFNVLHKDALKNSNIIHDKYDWENVSKPTIKRLKNIFKSRGFRN